ncbi:MAG: 2Fe-2S iron-sulfur cluster binding domain protein [Acidobacteria bacterium OLB17]|nr:MAG: 2Fe-2S iron-sulfur cluster binding domain protein [Acidobacteria bacterium OLB17]MCZ2389669.1 (2Fe-2S)-binding protein [Acidobacteriota bacterium]
MANELYSHLRTFSEADWLAAAEELQPEIHAVDQDAVRIWFRFYPLDLRLHLEQQEDRAEAERILGLQGSYMLEDSLDTSAHFLYGYRYWPQAKAAVNEHAGSFSADAKASLVDLIKAVGAAIAKKAGAEQKLTNAIAAVALATFNQVGAEEFAKTKGDAAKPSREMSGSPQSIVAAREKDASQGIFGFLKTVDKKFEVKYAAPGYSGKFEVYDDQEITHAAGQDRSRDWKSLDKRCWQGPIPIECTAAACGTCWVGVLGGKEKLDPVKRRERYNVKLQGYHQPDEERPYLRLACQARAHGNVTLVIPPWNGVFGKQIYHDVEEVTLDPVTTAAKHLRETIAAGAKDTPEEPED